MLAEACGNRIHLQISSKNPDLVWLLQTLGVTLRATLLGYSRPDYTGDDHSFGSNSTVPLMPPEACRDRILTCISVRFPRSGSARPFPLPATSQEVGTQPDLHRKLSVPCFIRPPLDRSVPPAVHPGPPRSRRHPRVRPQHVGTSEGDPHRRGRDPPGTREDL